MTPEEAVQLIGVPTSRHLKTIKKAKLNNDCAAKVVGRKFQVGDKVRCLYGEAVLDSTILKTLKNSTYSVKFADGDIVDGVEESWIAFPPDIPLVLTIDVDSVPPRGRSKQVLNRDSLGSSSSCPRTSTAQNCKRQGHSAAKGAKYSESLVSTKSSSDIVSSSDEEELVLPTEKEGTLLKETPSNSRKRGRSEPKVDTAMRTTGSDLLQIGDAVKSPFRRGAEMLQAVVTKVHKSGYYDVVYLDGDVDLKVPADHCILLEELSDELRETFQQVLRPMKLKLNNPLNDNRGAVVPRTGPLVVNRRVECNWNSTGIKFLGIIERVKANGTFVVRYDDGDSEDNVLVSNIYGSEADGPDVYIPFHRPANLRFKTQNDGTDKTNVVPEGGEHCDVCLKEYVEADDDDNVIRSCRQCDGIVT